MISELRRIHEEQMGKLREEMREAIAERDRAWQMQIEEHRVEMQRLYEKWNRGLRERLVDWWDDVNCVPM